MTDDEALVLLDLGAPGLSKRIHRSHARAIIADLERQLAEAPVFDEEPEYFQVLTYRHNEDWEVRLKTTDELTSIAEAERAIDEGHYTRRIS